MKRTIIKALALSVLLLAGSASLVFAAPTSTIFRTIIPETNNTYGVGTSTRIWGNVYTRTLNVSGLGDAGSPCLIISNTSGAVATTTCSAGGSGSGFFNATGTPPQFMIFNSTSTATSTGPNLTFVTSTNRLNVLGTVSSTFLAFNYATGTTLTLQDASGTGVLVPNAPLNVYGSVNSYLQAVHVQNQNPGSDASGDFVITANNGNNENQFLDLGLNSSGFTSSTFNVVTSSDGYLYTSDGSLLLGAATTSAVRGLGIFTGGTLQGNIRLWVMATGNIGVGTQRPSSTLHVIGTVSSTVAVNTVSVSSTYLTSLVSLQFATASGTQLNSGAVSSTNVEALNGLLVRGIASSTELRTASATIYAAYDRTGLKYVTSSRQDFQVSFGNEISNVIDVAKLAFAATSTITSCVAGNFQGGLGVASGSITFNAGFTTSTNNATATWQKLWTADQTVKSNGTSTLLAITGSSTWSGASNTPWILAYYTGINSSSSEFIATCFGYATSTLP